VEFGPTSVVPDVLRTISGDDFAAAGPYVADFNESAVEEVDMGWVPCGGRQFTDEKLVVARFY